VIDAVAGQLKKGGSRSRQALDVDSKAPAAARTLGGDVDIGSLEGGESSAGEPDGVVQGRLRPGLDTTTPPSRSRAPPSILDLTRPIPFTSRSNLRFVLLTAKNLPRTAVVVYFVHGQQA
jgi:hypothetical protein